MKSSEEKIERANLKQILNLDEDYWRNVIRPLSPVLLLSFFTICGLVLVLDNSIVSLTKLYNITTLSEIFNFLKLNFDLGNVKLQATILAFTSAYIAILLGIISREKMIFEPTKKTRMLFKSSSFFHIFSPLFFTIFIASYTSLSAVHSLILGLIVSWIVRKIGKKFSEINFNWYLALTILSTVVLVIQISDIVIFPSINLPDHTAFYDILLFSMLIFVSKVVGESGKNLNEDYFSDWEKVNKTFSDEFNEKGIGEIIVKVISSLNLSYYFFIIILGSLVAVTLLRSSIFTFIFGILVLPEIMRNVKLFEASIDGKYTVTLNDGDKFDEVYLLSSIENEELELLTKEKDRISVLSSSIRVMKRKHS